MRTTTDILNGELKGGNMTKSKLETIQTNIQLNQKESIDLTLLKAHQHRTSKIQ